MSNEDVQTVDAAEEDSEYACVVCFKNIEIYSVGSCDHPFCHECSTRMRVLCQQNECPICRQSLSKVCSQASSHVDKIAFPCEMIWYFSFWNCRLFSLTITNVIGSWKSNTGLRTTTSSTRSLLWPTRFSRPTLICSQTIVQIVILTHLRSLNSWETMSGGSTNSFIVTCVLLTWRSLLLKEDATIDSN